MKVYPKISVQNLAVGVPVHSTITLYLLLDKLKLNESTVAVIWTIWAILSIVSIIAAIINFFGKHITFDENGITEIK